MEAAVQKTETKTNLGEFFSKEKAVAPAKEAKAEQAETKPKAEEKKAEAKAEVKTEKGEVKDEKQKEQQKEKELLKTEAKPDAKKEEKPSVNWEDDSNPYKKRYQDTASWGNGINQELKALQKQNEIINKKLDGTYDPEKDKPPTISPDQERANAETEGRVRSSKAAAYKQYGKEKVDGMLGEFYAKHGQDPWMMNRVMNAELPAIEVMDIMAEQAFKAKYGNDPDAIYKSIRKEAEESMRAEIEAAVRKEWDEKITQKEKQPSGLSEVKGAANAKDRPYIQPGLEQLFAK